MNNKQVYVGTFRRKLTEEERKINKEHYEEIKDKVYVKYSKTNFCHYNYFGIASTDLTAAEIALVLDKGNLDFGYSGGVDDQGNFSITIFSK